MSAVLKTGIFYQARLSDTRKEAETIAFQPLGISKNKIV